GHSGLMRALAGGRARPGARREGRARARRDPRAPAPAHARAAGGAGGVHPHLAPPPRRAPRRSRAALPARGGARAAGLDDPAWLAAHSGHGPDGERGVPGPLAGGRPALPRAPPPGRGREPRARLSATGPLPLVG